MLVVRDRIQRALSYCMDLWRELCAKADVVAKASAVSAAPFSPASLYLRALENLEAACPQPVKLALPNRQLATCLSFMGGDGLSH